MNYNTWSFWLLFLIVFIPYWRLTHKQQNVLLLVASYVFYGFWDYRFLTLVLVATVIDYIGGLGVAGIELSRRQLVGLGGIIIAGVGLLCTGIDYPLLMEAICRFDTQKLVVAIPFSKNGLCLFAGTIVGTIAYLGLVSWLYRCAETRRRKLFVAVSMTANLAMLGFFKYCDFFIHNMQHLLDTMGLGYLGGTALGIVLPPGISFYTFQAMSYTVDVYRGHAKPTRSFSDFALFICFFPHLVAGPIMRASTLLPQVVQPRRIQSEAWASGALLILVGMFKKIVVADNMAPIASHMFCQYAGSTGTSLTAPEILLGIYAFAFQIYGDFSGYSSIARGISKWLGFELVVNFHLPYLSVSPSDFWRRWHISLSSWLRDYLYIPLGGSRRGEWMTYRNLMLTMLLGGLWHGANWTFVLWGLYHGAILCLFRLLKIVDPVLGGGVWQRVRWALRVLVMFHLTCFGWLLFRADSLNTVARMCVDLTANMTFTAAALPPLAMILFFCVLASLIEWFTDGENRLDRLLRARWGLQSAVVVYLIVMILFFQAEGAHEFIYFQF